MSLNPVFSSERDDLLYLIALMNIRGIGSIYARHLVEQFGSARAVFEADRTMLSKIARIGQALVENLGRRELLDRAQEELDFIAAHHICPLVYGAADYPKRLLDCSDAPALLFYRGADHFESRHVIGIVGTRSCTQYGREAVREFVENLASMVPDIVIVSGLALGIDVAAHKAALGARIPTVGVLAHGLDRIYPAVHRDIAKQMLASEGGILTEYPSGTEPERGNFLARNRIIAGLVDAVVVAESSDKGGALVTASIANSYNREVYAFPGRISDRSSRGCNRLIRQNKAALITSAADFVEMMNWETASSQPGEVQQQLCFEEDASLRGKILHILREKGSAHISVISQVTGFPVSLLAEELLNLEIEGAIRVCPGGIYELR